MRMEAAGKIDSDGSPGLSGEMQKRKPTFEQSFTAARKSIPRAGLYSVGRRPAGDVCFALLANLLILVTLLILFRPVYETNDDMAIALFVNGAKGSYDAHLVYSNYLLGLGLSVLYRLTVRLPWYALAQYAALFLSFTAILYVAARRAKNSSVVWLTLTAIYFFAYDGYIRLQYTKTAGIVSSAGILLLLYAAELEKKRRGLLVCGYLLACLGFMYREQQFLAELALMSGVGVFLLLEGADKTSRFEAAGGLRRRFLRCAAIFGALLVLVGCLHLADRYAYRSPQWQEYLEYNDLRTELLDYGFPPYAENKEVYQELGINRTALQLYRGWNYVDTEKFTTETMRRLIALKEPRRASLQLLKGFWDEVPIGLLQRTSFCCFLLIAAYSILWGKHTKYTAATRIYELALVTLLYLYQYYTGRYLYNRVDVGLWLAVTLVFLWVFEQGKAIFDHRAGAALLITAALLSQGIWKGTWRINSEAAVGSMLEKRAVQESIGADKEHLYMVKSGAVSYAEGYGVFDSLPYGVAQNILSLGGWPALTPGYRELMETYGISNPYRDMIGNEDVYLVDRDIDTTLKYIHKYYDKSAQAVLVSEYPGCKVYQVVSGD